MVAAAAAVATVVVVAATAATEALRSIDGASSLPVGPERRFDEPPRAGYIAHSTQTLITLMFHPERSDSAVLVRGACFRIHSDGTLRGPDNAVSATYTDGLWQLGPRRYQAFECAGPIYLRVTDKDGRRECIGPYDFVKVAEGAVLTHDSWLGAHATRGGLGAPVDLWQEIAFLTST